MRVIIVDDEPKSRNLLLELMKKEFSDIEIVGMAASGKEGMQQIRQQKPDVVFLDINMPGMNGFEMLQALQPVNFDTVFITAYDQFAIKAFRYQAFDYLLKPIDVDEFSLCITRLKEKKKTIDFQERLESLINQWQHPAQIPDRITIHAMDGITVIPVSEIIYMEAAGAYTLFYRSGQDKIVSSVNLKEYEELLTDRGFFRSHNSFLVNMLHVRKLIKEDGGSIVMSNGNKVLLSKRKKEGFIKILEHK